MYKLKCHQGQMPYTAIHEAHRSLLGRCAFFLNKLKHHSLLYPRTVLNTAFFVGTS